MNIWNIIVLEPIMNVLIALSGFMFNNFGLSIIVLTIVIRLAMTPLTQRQTKSSKAMSELQPKIQELQRKYKRDQRALQAEMTKLYKQAGINPLGCLWPMLIQFPIWICLYQAIMQALAATPEDLLYLSQHLYQWPLVQQGVPATQNFLWLNLAQPDSLMILAILTGGTMWVQQKMVTAPATDPRQKQMTQMTTLMMPLMFGLFTLQFPSGLALYWVVSNIVGIIIQYVTGGWGYLRAPAVSPVLVPQQKPPEKK